MKQTLFSAMSFLSLCLVCNAQATGDDTAAAVRSRIRAYVQTFNNHDAAAVAAYWTADGVSVDEETGERKTGRDALHKDFQQFFEDYPNAQLSGSVDHLRGIGPNVVIAEGRVTLLTEEVPVQTAFTAVFAKQDDQWLIASSHERDLPSPSTAYDGLKELEWLIGSWQDQTDGTIVNTTWQWSPSRTFLIRSYRAEFENGGGFTGTQIFGWDPLAKQIRTWTFNSDGSYGDGTVSRNGSEWMVKMNHMRSDGQLASGTHIITQIDDDTLQIQKIGESINGEPVPASDPITVVRTADADTVSNVNATADEGTAR